MNTKVCTSATYILSLSLFVFAGALTYFTITISGAIIELPNIMSKVSAIAESIDKASDAVNRVAGVIEENQTVAPLFIQEIRDIRLDIPQLLDRVDQTFSYAETLTQEIHEVRLEIPQILDRADQVISHAKTLSKDAGKGAVVGAITGVVTAPFAMVANLGKKLSGVGSEQHKGSDYKLIEEAALKACHSQQVGAMIQWDNPESPNHGYVVLTAINTVVDKECRSLTVGSWVGEKQIQKNDVVVCREPGAEWHLQGD